jgi:hypothetical protein
MCRIYIKVNQARIKEQETMGDRLAGRVLFDDT